MTAMEMLRRYGPGIITNITPPRNPFMESINRVPIPVSPMGSPSGREGPRATPRVVRPHG